MNDDSRFTESAMVSAEVANRAINDALQFTATPGAALSPDYAELRKLAEAATPGPWETRYETDDECSFIGYSIHSAEGKAISDEGTAPNSKDALFIAAANPAVILRLLDLVGEPETLRLAQQAVDAIAGRAPMTKDEVKQWAHDLASSPTGTNDAEIRAALAAPVAVAPSPAGESLTYTVDGVIMSALEYINHLHGELDCSISSSDMPTDMSQAKRLITQLRGRASELLATHRQPEDGAAKAGERDQWTRQELVDEIAKLESVVEMCNKSTQKWKDRATKEASVQGVPESKGGAR